LIPERPLGINPEVPFGIIPEIIPDINPDPEGLTPEVPFMGGIPDMVPFIPEGGIPDMVPFIPGCIPEGLTPEVPFIPGCIPDIAWVELFPGIIPEADPGAS
jgi:hypothetical protein